MLSNQMPGRGEKGQEDMASGKKAFMPLIKSIPYKQLEEKFFKLQFNHLIEHEHCKFQIMNTLIQTKALKKSDG